MGQTFKLSLAGQLLLKTSTDGFEFYDDFCTTPIGSQIEMTIRENGQESEVLWQSRVFKFTNSENVYMHCKVNVCIEDFDGSCAVECAKSRSPRDVSYDGQNVVSLGPIRFTGYSKAEYLIIDPATGLVGEQGEEATFDAEFNFINHFLIALITLITMVMLVAIYGATRKCPTEDSTLA
ncbi:Oidioi.mRNA.OKI2018_I69.chr2.g3995.t1.cds [Oikopleura dioica]|uniref:Oidioi.mRNA.OKI2018_I69.chr2.g3995.t1.cds n=1 Tax=Oikopleura dioica TaxID=34765 RepID=A0ABN7SWF6_OIKDI|nr:Oidioi.mRNA.OKI2018_I69.chr2.g3995.t1.cds [Oikopleura dioica]